MFQEGSYITTSNNTPQLKMGMWDLVNKTFNTYCKMQSGVKSTYSCLDVPEVRLGLFPILYYLKEASRIAFEHIYVRYTKEDIETFVNSNTIPRELIKYYYNASPKAPVIKIVHLHKGVTLFSELNKITGLEEHKGLSLMLQNGPTHKIRCYTNIRENTVVILTADYDWHLLRKIIACIPIMFPHLELPKEALELIPLYAGTDYDKWITKINTWIDSLDIINKQLKEALHNLTNYNLRNTISSHLSRQRQINADVTNYLNGLGGLYKEAEEIARSLNLLENAPEDRNDDLFNYISKHPAIVNLEVSAQYLYMRIMTPLVYYDTDALKAYYKSSTSIITKNSYIARMFDEVFLQREYSLITECVVKLDLNQNRVTRSDHWNLSSARVLGQPHIVGYNCWGSNASAIIKALSKQDLIFAIEQTIAACQNLNFTDSTVLSYFVENILSNTSALSIQNNATKEKITIQELFNKYKKEEELLNETNKDIRQPETKLG